MSFIFVEYLFISFLINDTLSSSNCTASYDRMISKQLIIKYVGGSGRILLWNILPEFVWRCWGKQWETSLNIAGLSAGIWNQDPRVTKKERYLLGGDFRLSW
jgi:hypothetical protein